MHKSVIDGGLTNPGEAVPVYDYNADFQYISSVFGESDLTMGNFEGTLNGPPYSGFPSFSAPGVRTPMPSPTHCTQPVFVSSALPIITV